MRSECTDGLCVCPSLRRNKLNMKVATASVQQGEDFYKKEFFYKTKVIASFYSNRQAYLVSTHEHKHLRARGLVLLSDPELVSLMA